MHHPDRKLIGPVLQLPGPGWGHSSLIVMNHKLTIVGTNGGLILLASKSFQFKFCAHLHPHIKMIIMLKQ